MLSGLPASGKTTRAKELISGSADWARVNRDELRPMLHGDKAWNGRLEGVTVKAERAIVRRFLESNINVVVDDTNLSEKGRLSWNGIASEVNAKFEVIKMNTPLEECLDRDDARANAGERSVGRHIIINMAREAGFDSAFGESEVIFDLDGTLANLEHRLHYIQGELKDWNAFFEACGDDWPIEENILKAYIHTDLDRDLRVIIVSGRSDQVREKTEFWLKRHQVPYYTLIMRRANDTRPDYEVKEKMFQRYFRPELVKKVYDDRPRIIRMWRDLGLDVVDVGNQEEF